MAKGSTNKTKGSNAERLYAKVFREDLGFSFCKCSRQSNRMLDDAGIDLDFLPFNVQIKAGYASGLNEHTTLKIIRERLPLYFPPFHTVHKQVDILIHRKDCGAGRKRKDVGDLVFVWEKDFETLMGFILNKDLIPHKKGSKRGWSFEELLAEDAFVTYEKDDENLVAMTFKTFKTLILNSKKWQ